MATLILFQSRYGYTEKCANTLASMLDDVTTVSPFKPSELPTLELYDTIVFAGSIRFGQIQPELKLWLSKNEALLENKSIALIIACGFDDNFEEYIARSFPKSLTDSAIASACVGGALDGDMGFIDRKIVAMVKKETAKTGQQPPCPKPEALETLAAKLNEHFSQTNSALLSEEI